MRQKRLKTKAKLAWRPPEAMKKGEAPFWTMVALREERPLEMKRH